MMEGVLSDRCGLCDKPATNRCSRCITIKYCSRECQKNDWKRHKIICNSQKNGKEESTKGHLQSKSNENSSCNECGGPATQKCANCRKVHYCKRQCQQNNWKEHKQHCYPFQVERNSEVGRYVISTRSIKAGELLLKEDPLLVGPLEPETTVCLGCYKPVDGSYRCSKCSWPLCSKKCESSENHQPECQLSIPVRKEIEPFLDSRDAYKLVLPLRALYFVKDNLKYEKLKDFQSTAPNEIKNFQKIVVLKEVTDAMKLFIKKNHNIIKENPESFMRHVMGAIEINGFEVPSSKVDLMGLYPRASLFEHSCLPNIKHKFTSSNQIVFKACVDIPEGEHICTTYTKILWGTIARQKELLDNKYFVCRCKRCLDPTELGTYFSALKCLNCSEGGYFLPENPLNVESQWPCNKCDNFISSSEASRITEEVGDIVEKVVATPSEATLESLLRDCVASKVHVNHYHLFKARHTLLQMYGRNCQSVRDDILSKKELLCQEFIDFCSLIDPGNGILASYVGVALYEYEGAVMTRVQKLAGHEYHKKETVEKLIAFAKALLQRCIKTLQDEKDDEPGGVLRNIAKKKLSEIGLLTSNIMS